MLQGTIRPPIVQLATKLVRVKMESEMLQGTIRPATVQPATKPVRVRATPVSPPPPLLLMPTEEDGVSAKGGEAGDDWPREIAGGDHCWRSNQPTVGDRISQRLEIESANGWRSNQPTEKAPPVEVEVTDR